MLCNYIKPDSILIYLVPLHTMANHMQSKLSFALIDNDERESFYLGTTFLPMYVYIYTYTYIIYLCILGVPYFVYYYLGKAAK